eukprot:TRINITY_DN5516_c0_g1_i8.p1 TRINITY_DN5516_c0_g1~~TRINITY_DN5516_c0_g1_i8.p1  ORF type:complete len:280 (-),score=-20.02 TRINITY_DN5516_c0_g1_i8:859-1698(-)
MQQKFILKTYKFQHFQKNLYMCYQAYIPKSSYQLKLPFHDKRSNYHSILNIFHLPCNLQTIHIKHKINNNHKSQQFKKTANQNILAHNLLEKLNYPDSTQYLKNQTTTYIIINFTQYSSLQQLSTTRHNLYIIRKRQIQNSYKFVNFQNCLQYIITNDIYVPKSLKFTSSCEAHPQTLKMLFFELFFGNFCYRQYIFFMEFMLYVIYEQQYFSISNLLTCVIQNNIFVTQNIQHDDFNEISKKRNFNDMVHENFVEIIMLNILCNKNLILYDACQQIRY